MKLAFLSVKCYFVLILRVNYTVVGKANAISATIPSWILSLFWLKFGFYCVSGFFYVAIETFRQNSRKIENVE